MPLLSPKTHEIPQEDKRRRKDAIRNVFAASLVFVFFIIVTIIAVFLPEWRVHVWPMVGLDILNAAILVWAYVYYYKRSTFTYEVEGITVIFDSSEYYVPPAELAKLIRSVYAAWEPILAVPVREVYEGVVLQVRDKRPIDPLGRTDDVVGLTYHGARRSEVWGPYILDVGGAGYELLLHGAKQEWPTLDEGAKIRYMKEMGVFDTLQQVYGISNKSRSEG